MGSVGDPQPLALVEIWGLEKGSPIPPLPLAVVVSVVPSLAPSPFLSTAGVDGLSSVCLHAQLLLCHFRSLCIIKARFLGRYQPRTVPESPEFRR